jgi:hypothetical protein
MKRILLFFIIIISFWSCGARKSKTTKIDTEIKKDLVINTDNNVKTKIITEIIEDEVIETVIYTPVDNTKPSKVDDTEFTNTTIIKKKTTLKTDKKVDLEVLDLTISKVTDKGKETVKVKEKETEREKFNYLLLLPPFLIIYFIYKKIKRVT